MLEACLGLRRGISNDTDIAATLSRWRQCDCASVMQSWRSVRGGACIFRRLGDRVGKRSHCCTQEICAYVGETPAPISGSIEALAREIKYSKSSDCQRVLGQLALSVEPAEARACRARSLAVCQAARDNEARR